MKLNPPETAPKDTPWQDTVVILADFGLGFLQPAVWNVADQQWSAAKVKRIARMVWDERYFVHKPIEHSEMRGWLPMPQIDDQGNVI